MSSWNYKKCLELQNFQQLCSMTSTYPGKMCVYFFRSSRSHVFFKMGFLKNFANFTRETPVLESLLNKVARLKPCKFIKKRLQYMCFPVKNANFLKTPFLQNIFGGCFYFWAAFTEVWKRVSFCLKVMSCHVWWLSFFFVNKDPGKVYSKQLRSRDSANQKKNGTP